MATRAPRYPASMRMRNVYAEQGPTAEKLVGEAIHLLATWREEEKQASAPPDPQAGAGMDAGGSGERQAAKPA
jgi:hypothetical protein